MEIIATDWKRENRFVESWVYYVEFAENDYVSQDIDKLFSEPKVPQERQSNRIIGSILGVSCSRVYGDLSVVKGRKNAYKIRVWYDNRIRATKCTAEKAVQYLKDCAYRARNSYVVIKPQVTVVNNFDCIGCPYHNTELEFCSLFRESLDREFSGYNRLTQCIRLAQPEELK